MTEFKKQIFSGICVCTHPFQRHHISFALNPEYKKQTGECQIADECLHYGFNEGTQRAASRWQPGLQRSRSAQRAGHADKELALPTPLQADALRLLGLSPSL